MLMCSCDMLTASSSRLCPQSARLFPQSAICCWYVVLCGACDQRWYAAGGYKQPRPKQQVKAATPDLGNMSDADVAALFSRFFEWFVVHDRPGDPVYNRAAYKVRLQRMTYGLGTGRQLTDMHMPCWLLFCHLWCSP